jgi:hypothetical protein
VIAIATNAIVAAQYRCMDSGIIAMRVFAILCADVAIFNKRWRRGRRVAAADRGISMILNPNGRGHSRARACVASSRNEEVIAMTDDREIEIDGHRVVRSMTAARTSMALTNSTR